MSSRDDILASIRANLPRVDRPLPDVPLFDDDPPASLLAAFKDSLHRMGGMFLDPPPSGDILAPVRTKIAGRQSRLLDRAGDRGQPGYRRRWCAAGSGGCRFRHRPRIVRRCGDRLRPC